MSKKTTYITSASVLATSLLLAPMTTIAEGDALVTGNAGILSDYIFRGIPQDTGSGNGGVDFEYMGFYAGTWIADVGEGVEYDLYGGYTYTFENGIYLGAGYTSYQYSDDFDDEYNEVNLKAGGSAGDVSLDLEYSVGDYNGEFGDGSGGIEGDDYDFLAATIGYNGVYLTYGDFGDDADDDLGHYFELGYTMEMAGFELTGALVHTDDADILGTDDDDETQGYVSISWGFDVI